MLASLKDQSQSIAGRVDFFVYTLKYTVTKVLFSMINYYSHFVIILNQRY